MNNMTFSQLIEELILISEIIEIPGMKEKRSKVIKLCWDKFPEESESIGLIKDVG